MNDDISNPRAREKERFLIISSRESFLPGDCFGPPASSDIPPVV